MLRTYYLTPWARSAMTPAEMETLRSLDIEGSIAIFRTSARGLFSIRLTIPDRPEFRATGNTVAEALSSLIEQVAA